MLTTYEKRSKLKLATTVVAVLVVVGLVMVVDHMKSKAGASTVATIRAVKPASPAASSGSSSSSATTASTPSGYKDGTYNASSSYYVPGNNQQIQVSVTLKNGVVTASSVQNSESDPTSASFQQDFASQYKSYVVGQKLSSLQIGVIAGASDTTQGFVDALNQIASQAQA